MSSPSSCQICLESFNPQDSPFSVSSQSDCTHFTTSICVQCADSWLKENFSKLKSIHSTNPIKCPIENCSQGLQPDFILQNISFQKLPQAEEQLFQNYCRQTFDIVSCPIQTCGFKGFLAKQTCTDEITCEVCNHKWRESIPTGLLKTLKDIKETKTRMFKYFHTKNCPSCFSPIQKNGGCNNMRCLKCNCSFCWLCLNPNSKHPASCGIKIFLKSLLLFSPILQLYRKAGFFKFYGSLKLIKKPEKWYGYLAIPFKVLGLYFRIGMYYSLLVLSGVSLVSFWDLVRQTVYESRRKKLARQNNEQYQNTSQILITRAKKLCVFSTAALVGVACLTKLIGSKNEVKALIGVSSLAAFFTGSIIAAQYL